MQVAEARIGRLSSSQREFITLQSEKNSLVERKRKRSNEEDALLRRVQIKLKNRRRDMSDYDDRLIIKPKSSAKSGAQRVAKTRASQGKKSDSTGAERQARRRSGWSRQRVEKEMEEDRVRKVSKRAGGLSQARKEDVRAGQRKNKDTEVFSGDALKTKEITEGNFIVEPLTGGRDGLGNLGDITCNFCGALKWKHETSPSMCCYGGKVSVPAYPSPPPELMRLWFDDSRRRGSSGSSPGPSTTPLLSPPSW